MRVETPTFRPASLSQIGAPRRADDLQFSQKPQIPQIRGSGSVTDDGTYSSVHSLQLSQNPKKPSLGQGIGKLAEYRSADLSSMLHDLNQEALTNWPPGSDREHNSRLQRDILNLLPVSAQQRAYHKAFESPRPAPPLPTVPGRNHENFSEPTKRPGQNKPHGKPPLSGSNKESGLSKLVDRIAPPVQKKLQKSPKPPIGPILPGAAHRLMNKIAPPVKNKLRKAPPPAKEEGVISELINKLAPPVKNKLHKKQPFSPAIASRSISYPVLHQHDLGAEGMEYRNSDQGLERNDTQPVSTWSMSTASERGTVSRFFDRCTAEIKNRLRQL